MENLTLAQLAKLFNSVAEKPVAKFKDKPTGIARLEAQMAEKRLVLVFDAEGVASLAPEGWDKVETSSDSELTVVQEEVPHTGGTPIPAETTEAKRAGRVSKLMGKRVTVVSETNPKRKDSATAKRFALYSKVATSDEYMALCLEKKLGTTREVLSDLAYDSKKGFIKLA